MPMPSMILIAFSLVVFAATAFGQSSLRRRRRQNLVSFRTSRPPMKSSRISRIGCTEEARDRRAETAPVVAEVS